MKDVRFVRIVCGEWVCADVVTYEEDTTNGEWGRAIIAGQSYTVYWSYDGDEHTQLAEDEIARYRLLTEE
ncbi:hypothetical protein [Dictyobacter kobayashii]|nr:hypothetical protein [Dictyobacter kobayashii]